MTILSYKGLHRNEDGRYYTQPDNIDTRTYWTDGEGNGLTNGVEGKLVRCENALHSDRTAEASCARYHKYRALVEIPDDSPIVGDEYYSRSMTLVRILTPTKFVEAIPDPNKASSDGNTPIYNAAYYGHADVVKALIEAKANVNYADSDGYTPIYWAACNGHADVVKALIAAGANVNQANKGGNTPIYNAAYYGHLDIVKALIEAGANVNQANSLGNTPIYGATCNSHLDVVKALKTAGAK